MATKIISSFFTKNGSPETGLTPLITIRELDPTNPALSTVVVNGAVVTEVGGGWYRYDFTTYDVTKDYVMTVDGGGSLAAHERYQSGANNSFKEENADETWNSPATGFLTLGTMGWLLNQIGADTQQIRIDVTSAISLIDTLLDYDENRTKIDKIAKTLTIYDDSGTTAIKVFDLKDSNGAPSVTEVCERVPQP